jgi:hypothetical protein
MTERAGVAALTDFREQPLPLGRAFGPPAREVGAVIRRGARFWLHDVTFRQFNQTHPALDAADAETQFAGDLPGRSIRVVKGSDLVKQCLTFDVATVPRPLSPVRFRLSASVAAAGCVGPGSVITGGCLSPDRRPQTDQLALHSFAEILEKMKAIGDLPCLRCALPRGISIKSGAVAADDLHFGMAFQPRRRGGGRTICQQVDDTPSLQIDDHGPVGHSFFPGPIVDPRHADVRQTVPVPGASFQMPQDRGVSHWHPKAGQQAFGWAPARAMSEKPHDPVQADSPARERTGEFGNTFGENAPFTPLIPAPPAGHPRLDRDWRPVRREILEGTEVRTMP